MGNHCHTTTLLHYHRVDVHVMLAMAQVTVLITAMHEGVKIDTRAQ